MQRFFSKALLCLLTISFLINLFPPIKVKAETRFSTGYNISFVFADNGQARVTQAITLTNLTDNLYASNYSLTISSTKISNVSGSDGSGAITVDTKTQDQSTVLTANLNQKVVGKDKAVNFQISYTIDSLSVKHGRIWEVNIPQIVTNENVSGYRLSLTVPDSFGALGRMSPSPDETSVASGSKTYVFTKTSQTGSGIGASFGDYQLFKFDLKYRYKNPNFFTTKVTVALPPDTEYQAMYYQTLDPKPSEIKQDANGNYLATYQVKAGKTLEVSAQGYAKLVDATEPFQIPKQWDKEELTAFTKTDKYIESENSQIQKKAKELKDVKAIYDYLLTTLKYDYNRLNNSDNLGRRGALAALNKPEQSICTDFSDLFVALARAKGIPARGLIGFAYADNSDLRPTKVEGLVDTTVLHAWPEYYDSEKGHWVQVDPTWGNTTGGVDYFNRLDTNHFVFAIYGDSSTYPYPAGAYKLSSTEVDDVKVEIVDQSFEQVPEPEINLSAKEIIAGFPGNTKLLVSNKSGRALFGANVSVAANQALGIKENKKVNVGTLLPFATNSYDLNVRSSVLFNIQDERLNFTLTGKDQSKDFTLNSQQEVVVKPFFSLGIPQVTLLVIFALVSISWFYPRLSGVFSSQKAVK